MAGKSGSCSALQWVERLLEPSASEEMTVEAVSPSLEREPVTLSPGQTFTGSQTLIIQ